jgi:hypothetical protein
MSATPRYGAKVFEHKKTEISSSTNGVRLPEVGDYLIHCFIIVSVYTIYGTDMLYFFTFTTCFGLMWPSSGTLSLAVNKYWQKRQVNKGRKRRKNVCF